LFPSNEEAIISAVQKLSPSVVNVSTVRLVHDSFFRTVLEELDKKITCTCSNLGEHLDREGRCPLGLFVKRSGRSN
jgi:hypothetical protein